MQLLLVPLDDSILFPGMTATIAADVGDAERVFVVARNDGDYANIGTVAEVVEQGRLPGGLTAVTLTGLHRGSAGAATSGPGGELMIEVEPLRDRDPAGDEVRELEREYRAVVEEILELRGDDGRVSAFLRSISEPGALADTSGYSPDLSLDDKQRLLETVDVLERLTLALELQRERLAELQVRARIRDDVDSGAQKQQREYFLRKQMESIRKELDEDDASIVEEYERKIAESEMPDAVREQAQRELGRLERMGEQSGESSMIRTYLDWLIGVPWGKRSEEKLDPGARPRGARRRPRRARGRKGPDHRVHRRAAAAPRPRRRRGRSCRRRDPHPDRPARHRQDLDRRVDRPRHRARVRAHVARRHPRRGRDPRPPPHLHRRPARADWCARSRTPARSIR